MHPANLVAGIVVRDNETGALGLVMRGGYRPRIQWALNNRTMRVDESRLRFAYPDEWAMRRDQKKKEKTND